MPFKSKAQAAYMHAAMKRGEMKPSVVEEFDAASKGHMGHLPEHVKQMAHGGYACMHCGGEVGEEGSAIAQAYGESEEPEEPTQHLEDEERRARAEKMFVFSIRGGR